jgi:hypothetical protein
LFQEGYNCSGGYNCFKKDIIALVDIIGQEGYYCSGGYNCFKKDIIALVDAKWRCSSTSHG